MTQAGRAEKLELLTRTLPGSEVGRLLRRFWQPIALSHKVKIGEAIPVRILGEELTLYRGASGRAYVVAGRCAHRCTLLHTGWVQDEDIRCIYHGWKYDGSGQCIEAPAEEDAFPKRIKISAYPVEEYGGLVFAYLGDASTTPDFHLLRARAIEAPGAQTLTKEQPWPCNWFQLVENSLDAVHVSFVHRAGKTGPFGKAVTGTIPRLEYFETEAGIRQIATRGKNNVRISDWTFPNCNHIVVPDVSGSFWMDNFTWRVPVDDEHTMRFSIYVVPPRHAKEYQGLCEHFEKYGDYNPADHHEDLFVNKNYPDEPFLQLTSAQDYVAMLGQGSVVDRRREHLGSSDRGVALLRKIFWREIDDLDAGRPGKAWKRMQDEIDLPIQTAN